MNTLWLKSLSKTPASKTAENDIQWIICNKIKKYGKWQRKGPLEKDLNFFLLNDNFKTLL